METPYFYVLFVFHIIRWFCMQENYKKLNHKWNQTPTSLMWGIGKVWYMHVYKEAQRGYCIMMNCNIIPDSACQLWYITCILIKMTKNNHLKSDEFEYYTLCMTVAIYITPILMIRCMKAHCNCIINIEIASLLELKELWSASLWR